MLHHRFGPKGRLATLSCAIVLLVSCGGGDDDRKNPAATSSDISKSLASTDGRAKRLSLPPGTPIPADAPTKGMFGPVQAWPLIPLHVVLTPDGRVLSYGTDGTGRQTAFFSYDVWDPTDGSHTTLVNGTGTDIFCSSQIVLPGGDQVLINGGDNWTGTGTTNTGNNNSNLFTVSTGALQRGPNMNRARWYSTSTMLLSGEVYIQGGSGGTDRPEIRGADGTFRLLSGANTGGFDFMYPRNFIAPDGRVFGYDSAGRMFYIDTSGTGSVTSVGQFASATAGNDASAAMFAPGRILQFGGNSAGAIVIDINGGGTPSVSTTASMAYHRRLGTATVMADGRVLATGGSSAWNAMTNVSYEAEIWNPGNGQWTRGATHVQARLYHSVALLLPDATVLVAGGGAPGPQNNRNGEIYYPPYLFNASAQFAERPQISTAPTVVDVGRTVQVQVSSARPISRVSFVKTGSVTHSWNMEQRFVDLPFNAASGGNLSVQIPGRASDVPPGTWMMFVIDDAGVPSVAKMVRVNAAGALNNAVRPTLASPGNQSTSTSAAVDLALSATDPNGDPLTYSASGLPPGLSIDPSTGRVTGTPVTVGSYSVSFAASDGINSDSKTITWQVTSDTVLILDPPPPTAPAAVGSVIDFNATATGSGITYSWDFGDGSAPTPFSASASASHVFANPGIYYVTVTARDSGGNEQRRTTMHQVHLAIAAQAPAMSSPLVFEPRATGNARLWAVNPDNDSVSVFDTVTRAKLAEVTVGTAPRTIALSTDGSVWVANKGSASISVIDASTLAVARTISLPRGSMPYGLALARNGGGMLVTLEATGQLLRIDTTSFATAASLAVGANPRHVAVASDGRTAYVSRFVTPPLPGEGTANVATTSGGNPVGGQVVVIDAQPMSSVRTLVLAHSDKPDAENQGRGFPNYLGATAISPDGSQAFVPSKMDNLRRGGTRDGSALNFQSTVRAISSRLDLANQREDLAARIDHDNASVASAAAFDPLGVYLFVALETSREIAIVDAHRRNQILRIDTGRAPQGVLVAPDRKTLYVHNFMDRNIGVYDLQPLTELALAAAPEVATLGAVGTEKLSATVLRGKQFFYDARDTRLARDRYMSCATCHNDGASDGRVWDLRAQGEGLRNTASLRGRSGALGQGRLHWSNNFDELQDFEGQIRALAGGSGLMSDAQFNAGTRSQPLGDAKAGLSPDLDALAAYVNSLASFDVAPSRPGAATLSAAATQGRARFAALNCAGCHSGAAFTRSGVDNPANIGTIKTTSGQRLFATLSGIDVPTLRDVWATAPYLHDGSADTLEAAIRAHLGLVATDTEVTQMAAYLRELGSDEGPAPAPASSGAGLLGSYYGNISLSGNVLNARIEAVNFDWGSGRPAIGIGTDNFSVRWTGTVTVPTSGSYRFRTVSDDGVRLWVNNNSVINNWTDHSPTTNTSGNITLTAGQRVPIRLEYYERGGGAVMRLQWRLPGQTSYVAIPAANLNTN